MSESQSPSAKQSQDKMPVFLACDTSFRLKAKAMTAHRDPATAPTQDDGENAERAWAGLKAKATTAHRDPAAAPAQDDSESAEKEMGPDAEKMKHSLQMISCAAKIVTYCTARLDDPTLSPQNRARLERIIAFHADGWEPIARLRI
ncbi:hypothetical protein C8R44DRAFT_863384 [Mycena epipterygia]|nr:hypothetical protein C8R44DRAFT_863384 [Mycena epipterygia]